jgi:hypothetical protein
VINFLTQKGINKDLLVFGGEEEKPEKPPRVPVDAQ